MNTNFFHELIKVMIQNDGKGEHKLNDSQKSNTTLLLRALFTLLFTTFSANQH